MLINKIIIVSFVTICGIMLLELITYKVNKIKEQPKKRHLRVIK